MSLIRFPLFLLFTFLSGSGCGDGLSDYERMLKNQKEAEGKIQAAGGTLEERSYPQGDAWAVNLNGIAMTPELLETLQHFSKGNRISEMHLKGTGVTDDYMERLNKMGGVFVILDLSETEVTDAGLAKLEGLFFLRELNLTGTQVTEAGVKAFLKARQDKPTIRDAFKKVDIKR